MVDQHGPQPFNPEHHVRPRVIVADDHPDMRRALCRILSADYELCEAADGASVLEMLSRLRVDAVVMDIQMPVMNGLVACSTIRHEYPETAVVIVTSHIDDGIREVARNAGAAAFVDKRRLAQDLRAAVRAALHTVSRGADRSEP